MENTQQTLDPSNENQSSQAINEINQVSQKRIRNNGIFFILWGWVMFYSGFVGYVVREILLSHNFGKFLGGSGKVFGLLVLAYTVYYIWRQRKKGQTHNGILLQYVWISMVGSFVLINLISSYFKLSYQLLLESCAWLNTERPIGNEGFYNY